MSYLSRRLWRNAALSFWALAAHGATLFAGPYSDAMYDGGNAFDPGVPGFVGPDGDGKSGGENSVNPIFVGWASSVVNYSPAPGVEKPSEGRQGFNDPTRALGPVTGNNFDIVSLGDLYAVTNAPSNGVKGIDYGVIGEHSPGSITLGFEMPISNGEGADFVVFENGFTSAYSTPGGSVAGALFGELAYVEVSTDGVNFARFPSVSLTLGPVGPYGTIDPTDIYNLAGKHANAYGDSWGTPFDLDDLVEDWFVLNGFVDLYEINFVRIVDIPGNGFYVDSLGNPIYDAWVTWGSGGFDLDAIGVINQIPEPSALLLVALALGGAMVGARRWRD